MDVAKLNETHTRHVGDALSGAGGSQQETLDGKRQDVITWLLMGRPKYEDILFELLADKQDGLNLYKDFQTMIDMRDRDMFDISNALSDYRRKSLTIPAEQLPLTEEYKKLREAYAQNGTKIRFVPRSQIANEPPCAGTDYELPSLPGNSRPS